MITKIGALSTAWKIPELRTKILYTIMILAVYRLAAHVPSPFIDGQQLRETIENTKNSAAGGIFEVMNLFSGQALENMSVLALGIMPYISVSIIIQLLTVVYPPLQKKQQEGALGQRYINRITRNYTVLLALIQSFAISLKLQSVSFLPPGYGWMFIITTMAAMTAGTVFVMWLGECITEKGVGNGISLIIAAGILASYPAAALTLTDQLANQTIAGIWAVLIVALFIASTISIILIQDGTRRIPLQHAKRQVGRSMMTGGMNYLPLKVNVAGVIPVIFSSAILAFPSFLAEFFGGQDQPMGRWFSSFFQQDSSYNLYNAFNFETAGGVFLLLKSFNPYIVLFALLTGFFCYFYTAVTFNPDDVASNLKKSGSFVPGKRPGKPTSEYIDYVLTRITTFGALFLVFIAVLPLVMMTSYGMPVLAQQFVGGTGLIIVIGVLLDTLKQVESQMLMRNYEGFSARRPSSRWS